MVSPLYRHPDAAVMVATYIATFNVMETFVHKAFDKALSGNGTDSDAVLGSIQSIGARMDVAESLIKGRQSALPWATRFLEIMNRMKSAAAYRNKLAHGLYNDQDGKLLLVGNILSRKRANITEELTPSAIKTELEKLDTLIQDALVCLGMLLPNTFHRDVDVPK